MNQEPILDIDAILKIKTILTHYQHNSCLPPISFFKSFRNGYDDLDKLIKQLYSKGVVNNYELAFLNKLHFTSLDPPCGESGNEEVYYLEDRQMFSRVIELFNNTDEEDSLYELSYYINANKKTAQRKHLEYNTNTLQIIPYIHVLYKGKTVLLKKIKKDSRTINKYDFPTGHWNANDKNISDCIRNELFEELGLKYNMIKYIMFKGAIPISNNIFSVSYYHLGLIYSVVLNDNAEIFNAEPDKHEISYLSDLTIDDICNFDNWLVYSLTKIKGGIKL